MVLPFFSSRSTLEIAAPPASRVSDACTAAGVSLKLILTSFFSSSASFDLCIWLQPTPQATNPITAIQAQRITAPSENVSSEPPIGPISCTAYPTQDEQFMKG